MTKEEIKRFYSMRDILEQYGIRPNRGGFINCPFHKEKTASMKIYEDSFHCFGCMEGGDQIDFVMKMDSLTFPEAFLSLGGSYDTGNKEEMRRKIKAAEIERENKQAMKEAEQRRKDENNRLITLLKNGLDCFPVYSDEWCYCQNELLRQIYIHEILSGIGYCQGWGVV